MMHAPSESNLQHGEFVLFSSLFEHGKRFKGRISEISGAVVLAGVRLCTEARVLILGKMVL